MNVTIERKITDRTEFCRKALNDLTNRVSTHEEIHLIGYVQEAIGQIGSLANSVRRERERMLIPSLN